MRPEQSLITLHEPALPSPLFRKLRQRIAQLGNERLRATYQTTFWFDGDTSNVAEEAANYLRRFIPNGESLGVEWWLSRMSTHRIQVDFHRDRDERLALRTGKIVHPVVSSVLFLNEVRGGLLAVTKQPPCDSNPALAPKVLDFDLVAPKPNRFAFFGGTRTHGVLDARSQIPARPIRGAGEMRQTLVINWWKKRPTDVPYFLDTRWYRALR